MTSLIINNNLYFGIVKYFMIFIGIWPREQIRQGWFKEAYRIYYFFPRAYMSTFMICQLADIPILLNDNNVTDVVEDLSLLITYLVEMFKIIVFSSDRVRGLYRIVEETGQKLINCQDENTKNIFKSYAKHAVRIGSYYCWFSMFVITMYDVGAYMEFYILFPKRHEAFNVTERPLAFINWFPFDVNEYYGLAFIIQLVTVHMGGYFYIVTQTMLLGLIVFVGGQLEILKYILRNFQAYTDILRKRLGVHEEEAAFAVMRCWIKEHQNIIRFNTELNKAIMYILLAEFILNSLLIASLLFKIATVELDFAVPFTLTYSVLMLSHIFILYWHTNEIKVKSISVADALMESNWYEQNQRVQKCALLILMRTTRPLTITCGPFAEASTSSIITILKASYSYAMLMLRT